MRSVLTPILALVLALPAMVSAQSLDNSMTNTNPFSVSVTPQYPTPNSQATLSFVSTTLDLTNATMTVSREGKNLYQGSIQPVTVPLGKAGSVTVLDVTITSGGTDYTQTVVIQPEEVTLIAEPISSAPTLYLGKPLVPLEGNTRIVAMANFKDAGGKTLDPSTLSYAWTVDGTRIANSSGIGKRVIIVASPLQYRERSVSVLVQNQNGSLVGGASLSLNPVEPTVRIYENDPLLGIRFNRALSSTYTINQSEASLYAAPFSLSSTGGSALIQWFLNGVVAQTGPSITLRPSGSGKGSASLSLTASSGGTAEATASLPLTFGAKPSSNLFGL